jgi:signal transduction histidine kinase/ActR/RegA family two-component response regulator
VEYLAEAVRSNRRLVRMERGAWVAMAASFALMIGPGPAIAWLIATLAFDLVSRRMLIAFAERGHDSMWRSAALAQQGGRYLFMGSLPLIASLMAGVWGLVNGEFALLCLVLNASIGARKSRAAFIASMVPITGYMAALVFLAFRRDPMLSGAACLAVGTIFLVVNASNGQRAAVRAAIALDEAKRRAEAATEAKSQFIALVSHELRTPLSGILASATYLETSSAGAAVREEARLIGDSSRMMRTLLDDLLDVSKLEAGRMSIEVIPFDLRAAIGDTLRFWRPQAQAKGLRLRLAGAHPLPAWVEGDPTRLRQILNNLLSNALKFTEHGSITLALAWRDEAEAVGEFVAEVRDTGPGMDGGQLARLFRPYDQLSLSTARTHGGTGLGLSISRELARAMGGDLSAASSLGSGAVFTLKLKLARTEPRTTATLSADEPPPGQLRCLVVDDHPVNRRAMDLLLGPVAREVVCVESAEAALEALDGQVFDIVFMDLNLAGADGREITRRVRKGQGANCATPIVALTGSVREEDVRSCLEAGMNAFVGKPVEAAQLYAAIGEALAGEAPAPAERIAAS